MAPSLLEIETDFCHKECNNTTLVSLVTLALLIMPAPFNNVVPMEETPMGTDHEARYQPTTIRLAVQCYANWVIWVVPKNKKKQEWKDCSCTSMQYNFTTNFLKHRHHLALYTWCCNAMNINHCIIKVNKAYPSQCLIWKPKENRRKHFAWLQPGAWILQISYTVLLPCSFSLQRIKSLTICTMCDLG